MALSFKISCLFLFVFLSANSFARENMFFSRVSTGTTAPAVTVDPAAAEGKSKAEEEPSFTQDTQNDNYGLYGAENGKEKEASSNGLGSSFFATQTTDGPTEYQTAHYKEINPVEFSDNEKSRTFDRSYEELLQHQKDDDKLVEESLQENADNLDKKQQKEEDELVNNSLQGYEQKDQTEDSKFENGYVPEAAEFQNQFAGKEGMSDTRYLNNGRYFYDVQNEQKFRRPADGYNYNFNNEQVTGNFQNQETGYYPSGQFHP